MTAEELLKQAADTIAERRETYGDPTTMMLGIAQRWSATLGQTVTPAEVALCLIDLKLARLAYNLEHQDSIVDIAGYAAILAELQS